MIIGTNLKTILDSNKNNIVAKKLLELESNEPSWISNVDYIDIALENKAKISFITKDRISRFIKEIKYIPEGYSNIQLKNSSPYKNQQQGVGTVIYVDKYVVDYDRCAYKLGGHMVNIVLKVTDLLILDGINNAQLKFI